ncbi:MAG: hypothetical protein RIE77_14910 [Phycisphaerales bacterium]|jgi:hypothetical protein
MHDDPYPPASDFTVGEAIGEGHKLLMANYGLMLGAAIVVALLTFAAMMVAGLIDAVLVGPDALFNPVSTAAQFLVQTPLGVGLGMLAARRYRDGEGSFEDIFLGFSRYWPVVAIGFLMTVGYMVLTLAGFAGGALVVGVLLTVSPPAAIAVGVVLGIAFLVLLIYLAVRLWFAYLVCIDPRGAKPGPIDSIKISWYLTSGRAFKVWLVGLVMGIIGLVCLVLLILPFIFYALPFYACAFGVLYVLLNPLPPEEGEQAVGDEMEPMGPPPLGA